MQPQIYNVLKRQIGESRLEHLYQYLKQFALSDSLMVIGDINTYLKYGAREKNEEGVPKHIIEWIERFFPTFHSKVQLTVEINRLARFLMLSGTNDYRDRHLMVNTPELQHAFDKTGQLFEPEVDDNAGNPLMAPILMGRIGQIQFPLHIDRRIMMGRAELLFLDIPSQFPHQYDFEAKMKEYYDIGAFEFMVAGHCLWIRSNGALAEQLVIEIEKLEGVVNSQSLERFIELSSGTDQQYKQYVRGSNWQVSHKKRDMYGLDPFITMPLVKIKRSMVLEDQDSRHVVPNPMYLLQRASWGIFYLLADKERELANSRGQSGSNEFRKYFGEVIYREYIARQLKLAQNCTVVDLDLDFKLQVKRPDFALIQNGKCVLIEVKTGLLTVESRTLYDESKIRDEILKGAFKKAVTQLTAFEQMIFRNETNDQRFDGVTDVIKIIVGYEDIQMVNAMLLPLLDEAYGSKIDNVQIACISDMEMLGMALFENMDICEWLSKKVATPEERTWQLVDFLNNHRQKERYWHPLLKAGYDNFYKRMM